MPGLLTPLLSLLLVALAVPLGVAGFLPPVAALHVALAMGVLPLIAYAVLQFVPVLTRTAAPGTAWLWLPEALRLGGVGLVSVQGGWLGRGLLSPLAALLIGLALALAAWTGRRARHCLGRPHPGWRWYAAALVGFAAALLAVLGMAVWPQHYAALRLIHLHANLLGLVGLAALGTLPVLLPTALGQADPAASLWLLRRLPLALGGLLLLALAIWLNGPAGTGMAEAVEITIPLWVGGAAGLIWAGLCAELLLGWARCFGLPALWHEPAARGLALATLGWCVSILASLPGLPGASGVAASLLPGNAVFRLWLALALFPMVSSALIVLLPVWTRPGPQTPARASMRAALGRGQGRRLALCVLSALTTLGGELWARAGVLWPPEAGQFLSSLWALIFLAVAALGFALAVGRAFMLPGDGADVRAAPGSR